MKKAWIILLLMVFSGLSLYAADPGNPFKKFGYTTGVDTLGDKEEFHDKDDIVQIGSVWFDPHFD